MFLNLCKYCDETTFGTKSLDICERCSVEIHPNFINYERVAKKLSKPDVEFICVRLSAYPYYCPIYLIQFTTIKGANINSLYDVYVSRDDVSNEQLVKIKSFIETVINNESQD